MDGEERVWDAVLFSAKAHYGQFRKGTRLPYVVHPIGVAAILIDFGCSEDVVVAGLLHDTLEDTPVTLEEIRSAFGEEVARLVEGASEPRHERDPWEERKAHTLDYLKRASRGVLLVACADKLDNIRAMKEAYGREGEAVFERFNRGKEKQRWYYRSLASVFGTRRENAPDDALLEVFCDEVDRFFGPL